MNPKRNAAPRPSGVAVAGKVLLLLACTAAGVDAQAALPPGWSVSAGVGLASTTTYPGASERYALPFPAIEASYSRGPFSVSASAMRGIAATYHQASTGFIWNLSMAPGPRRTRDGYSVLGIRVDHPEAVQALLASSPDAHTTVAAVAMVAAPSPVGLVGVTAGYAPTRVTPAEPDAVERTSHGARYGLLHVMRFPVGRRLTATSQAHITYMSGSHAAAWYSVERATASMPEFLARGGFEEARVALQADYHLSATLSLSVLGNHRWFLGDARRSPYTRASHSHDFVIQLLYRL
jgi:outer membrane scaffolding protein for murein synthesis (MipA/OmpV family)